jgi:hypothetical protein
MKARDIIPGWPRGHSTSVLSVSPHEKLFWFRFNNRLLGKFPPRYTPETRDHLLYVARVVGDEIDYHEGQQRMFDNFFEEWRTPDAPNEWGRLRKWIREGGRIATS